MADDAVWGVGLRKRFLHDGRAITLREAIMVDDGEAAGSAKAFRAMTARDQQSLLALLQAL